MKKKGVFFTFMALFLIILLIAVITTREKYRYRERSSAISIRVNTMNNFITDFEKDLDRELYIGGYRALISMNAYVRMIQGYIDNRDIVFSEILINGTANGTEMDLMKQDSGGYIQGADFSSWLMRMNQESEKLNIVVNVTVNSVNLEQTTPWSVSVILNATVLVADKKQLASWLFNRIYSKEFSILGFEDPLYTVETEDKMTNVINMTPDIDFVDDATKDPSVLNTHFLNSYYVNSTTAPSFLMRFSGNLSASPFGIESMVDVSKYYSQFGYYKARSVIDYIYFGNQTPTNYCNVSGMSSLFRIDDSDNHFILYEIDLLNKTACT